MNQRVELRLPPDDANVGLVRLVVVTAARQAGMDAERLEDLRLVVSEAATNALLSHQRVDSAHPVTVAFEVNDGAFAVTVSDFGPGFDPVDEVAAIHDESREGGLGLTLMRALADDASFEHSDGMHVRLRFTLAAAHA